jgi:polar amino acid transport system substrate-binding protein
MAAIRDRGRLVVGVSADTLLFGSVDPATGDVEGFDVDLLKEVAKAIFGEGGEDRIEYRIMPFAQRIPALQSGQVDLVAHTMTINCLRWQQIAFSSTYFEAGKKVLVPKASGWESIDDLVANHARVCAPSGSTSLAKIQEPQYAGVEIVEVTDPTACLVALQQGQADAIIGDDTVNLGLATQDPNVEVVGEPLSSEPYGIGVNAEQVDLVQFVNGVLEELRTNGRWAEIYDTWLESSTPGQPPAPEPPPPVYGR